MPVKMKVPYLAGLSERLWLGRNRELRAAAIVCAVILCADLGLFLAVERPLGMGIDSKRARITELRAKHAAAVLYQKQKKTLGGIAAAVPTQKDMPLLVKELELGARRLNLHVGPVNYDIPRPVAQGAALLSFSFPVTGKYPDLKRFLYEVEASSRLIGIESAEFKSDKGIVSLDLKLMTYVRG